MIATTISSPAPSHQRSRSMQLQAPTLPASVAPSDDLPRMIAEAAQEQAGGLQAGDVVVVAQKVVS